MTVWLVLSKKEQCKCNDIFRLYVARMSLEAAGWMTGEIYRGI